MKLNPVLLEASFIERTNRFAALVLLEGVPVLAHVPNSGRLKELFIPGQRVYLAPRSGPHRKTRYDLCLVAVDDILVSCDARLPPSIVEEALRSKRLAPFQGYPTITREVTFGDSRLDLLLEGPRGRCFIETKSVTLVPNGTALFPDAPTSRGTRHLRTLARAVQEGYRAAVIFVVQREDALRFRPHDQADQEFGATLRQTASQGVEVYTYNCRVSLEEVVLWKDVQVLLR